MLPWFEFLIMSLFSCVPHTPNTHEICIISKPLWEKELCTISWLKSRSYILMVSSYEEGTDGQLPYTVRVPV